MWPDKYEEDEHEAELLIAQSNAGLSYSPLINNPPPQKGIERRLVGVYMARKIGIEPDWFALTDVVWTSQGKVPSWVSGTVVTSNVVDDKVKSIGLNLDSHSIYRMSNEEVELLIGANFEHLL
jgi:hypothetical protein